jgi:hypothetical protein
MKWLKVEKIDTQVLINKKEKKDDDMAPEQVKNEEVVAFEEELQKVLEEKEVASAPRPSTSRRFAHIFPIELL